MTRLIPIILLSVLLGNFGFAYDAGSEVLCSTCANNDSSCRNTCMNICEDCDTSESSCLQRCRPRNAQPDNTSNAMSCNQQLAQLTAACQSETDTAKNDCDDSQNTGLAQAQQAAVAIGQQVSSSVQAACSGMGKISQAANAATAAYQMTCQSSVSSCSSACSQAIQFYTKNSGCIVGPPAPGAVAPTPTELKDIQKSCTSLQKKADTAQQAVNNFIGTTMQAQNCEQNSSGTSVPTPAICAANPQIAGCTPTGPVDCTKPEMASNKVCVCSKNPNDPSCKSGQNTAASQSPGVGGDSMVRNGSNAGADSGLGGDNFGLPQIDQASMPKGGADAGLDGKQGAGANLGGSGGGGGGADGKGGRGGAGGDPVGVNAGFYGGGGGSGGGYSGSGSGSGDGTGRGGYYAGKSAAAGGPNLRQFLPGGQLDPKARGVAGVSGPDGITGPHSNIWQKIQNRYQVVSPSLMP